MIKHLYFFGWPSHYGGADTKAAHLLELLAGEIPITVIPNNDDQLKETYWTGFFDDLGIRYCPLWEYPRDAKGVALALCNGQFITRKIYMHPVDRNMPIIWSSEMSWMHKSEKEVIQNGDFAKLLYVSEVQKKAINYESFTDTPTQITGNYIKPDDFPFVERDQSRQLTIGRLSRADSAKYPDDFPTFYEQLELPDVKFRVMAWSDLLRDIYSWHEFDDRWELLEPVAEPASEFLQSLDLFIYPLCDKVIESWGRSTVEAMLTGAIPIVPNGHHFGELILHGETGFLCKDFSDFKNYSQQLAKDTSLRTKMSHACREHAVSNLCNADEHRKIWLEALDI